MVLQPRLALVLLIGVSLTQGGCFLQPPSKQSPSRMVTVETKYAGASAQFVADTVAAPIEQQVNGVANLRYLRSRCGNDGTYRLTVALEPDVDLDMALVLVQNRVSLALPVLPNEVKRAGVTVLKKGSAVADGSALNLIIEDRNEHGFDDLAKLAQNLAEKLRTSDKLTEVKLGPSGRTEEQLNIEVNRVAAMNAGVALNDIMETLQVYFDSQSDETAKFLREKGRIEVRAKDRVRWAEEITQLKIRSRNGAMVPMQSLVKVRTVQGPLTLERFDSHQMVEITAKPANGVSSAEAQKFCEEQVEEVRKELKLGGGFTPVWLSAWESEK
jgi:multidrug efflux pump subunit AcrB